MKALRVRMCVSMCECICRISDIRSEVEAVLSRPRAAGAGRGSS